MPERYVGLLSGTSMDGIDAVVAEFETPTAHILAQRTLAFPEPVTEALDQARNDPDRFPAARLARLDALLGDAFAAAALEVIEAAGIAAGQIRAIGSHGQTILHRPDDVPPTTLQIGDPHRIAARTGLVTVADFRRSDLAAGGQGAPLAPLFHREQLFSAEENRVVLNLGGIANISILPASGGVGGFDTGPANCLLDAWYRRHHSGRFDPAGSWAASGTVDSAWLNVLLADGYFARPAPKSTGIEYFSPAWLDARLPAGSDRRPADVQATLMELSAQSIAGAIAGLPAAQRPQQIIVCGGGVHNQTLMGRLAKLVRPARLDSSARFGLDPDHIESLLFAWLARERLAGRPILSGPVTGAARPILAGSVVRPGDGTARTVKSLMD